MAFAAKTDYCGLSTAAGSNILAVRSATENASQSTYEPVGEDGEILGVEVYGNDAAPSNEYALKSALTATAGTIKLGTVVSIGSGSDIKKYRLESVKISTGANSPVSVSASAQLVESSATNDDTKNFDLPALSLATTHLAQCLFSAFTLTGTGANLTACDAEAKLSVSKDTLVGDIISNGAGSALLTVSGTILCSGSTVPTVTAATGWSLSKAPTCTNPETAYPTYEFELVKPLELHTSAST